MAGVQCSYQGSGGTVLSHFGENPSSATCCGVSSALSPLLSNGPLGYGGSSVREVELVSQSAVKAWLVLFSLILHVSEVTLPLTHW